MNGPIYTLAEIAERIGGQVVGDGSTRITGVAPLRQARRGDITLLWSDKTKFDDDLDVGSPSALVVDKPAEVFDHILSLFPVRTCPPSGIHPNALVDPSAELDRDVSVGTGAVVQADVRIGARTILWPGVFVGVGARIGVDCVLHPGVVVREGCTLGDRCVLHPNVVIGADGFGYRQQDGRNVKVPQVGRVEIGDDVEIGANSAVDRAKFGATTVGSGTKIDNLCQIAHNVQIGQNCVIMGQVGIAGSAQLGDNVMLAGHVGVADNVRIGSGTLVSAKALVVGDVPDGRKVISGPFAQDHRAYLKQTALVRRLPDLFDRVAELARKLESLEQPDDNQQAD